MKVDDAALGKVLQDRGLLSREEYEDAERARQASGRPLADILVEKSYLGQVQVQDAVAALEKRIRFCAQCNAPVYVTRAMAEGERCPRCLGPVQWQEEAVVAQIQDLDSLVQLTRDELPAEVLGARQDPSRIFGKYILVRELGKGGAGIVRKAWDTMAGEYVALKFIREQAHAADSAVAARRMRQEQIMDLLQEARAAMRLRHEHIIAVRDIGRLGQQYYIAMEFVEGRTLADHIRDSQARGLISPLYEDPIVYLVVLREMANALHYAHTFPRPIVHCDFKPANVLISGRGVPYIMDFGLARVLGGRQDPGEEEKIRGTPAYMAPEQLSGKPEEIGIWTDIYALGATLYELVAGRPVFTGEPLEILLKAMRDTPERPSEVVARVKDRRHESTKIITKITKLEEICLRCLAKDPKNRYPTARVVAEELQTVISAVEAGQDSRVLPARVLEAQARAEIHRVDEQITQMKLEEAVHAAERLGQKRGDTRMKLRLADRQQQVQFLEQLKTRMVDRLNEKRPTFARLKLLGEILDGVEVLKATPRKIIVLVGEGSRELAWSDLPAAQTVAIAEALGMKDAEDRLALGILCHHSRQVDLAVSYLTSLDGTPYQEVARHVLESTA
jgi:serine/threonine protein kinase